MIRKALVTLLFLTALSCFPEKIKNHSFNINFSLKPEITNQIIYRGASLEWNYNFFKYLHMGLGLRLMHTDYTSLWCITGTYVQLQRLTVPLDAGIGVEVLDIYFSENMSGVNMFLQFKSGFEWDIDNNWKYLIHGTYKYNLLLKDKHDIFMDAGIKYLF